MRKLILLGEMKKAIIGFMLIIFFIGFCGRAVSAFERPLGDMGKPADYEQTLMDHRQLIPDYDGFITQLPSAFDWNDYGIVTPAKDQGVCQTCWAFAAVGALESKIALIGGHLYDLSEQQQVSCNTYMGGCSGGGYMTALNFWNNEGPMRESCAQYLASNAPCADMEDCERLPYNTVGYYTVDTNDINEIKVSLSRDGPSYFSFTVYSDFFTFWDETGSFGEVYSQSSGSYEGGHAVLIIGWDDTKNAWLCKNSWGATAGPNGDGTFWIAYSGHANNLCFGMANLKIPNSRLTPDESIAYDPNNNRYLIVYQSNRDIYGQLRKCDGTPFAAEFLISDATDYQLSPSVVYDGKNRFLIVWKDLRNRKTSSSDIYGQIVNANGTLYGDNFDICNKAVSMQDNPSIGYDSANQRFLVVWSDYRNHHEGNNRRYDIYGQKLDTNGFLDGANFVISKAESNQVSPVVGYDSANQRFLVVWSDYRNWNSTYYDIYGQMLNADASLYGDELEICKADRAQTAPSVGYDSANQKFLVVWSDSRGETSMIDIYGQIVNPGGDLFGDPIVISDAENWQHFPSVAYSSANQSFLVVWMDYRNNEYGKLGNIDIYAQMVNDNGILDSSGNFVISDASDDQTRPSVAYNSNYASFLVAFNTFETGMCEIGFALPGDLNGDCDVNYDDHLVFRTAYGSCTGDENFIPSADFDGDGCVTINDYRILRTLKYIPIPVVNGLVLQPEELLTTSFNPDPVFNAPAGTFIITATFTNKSSSPHILNPFFKVAELSGGNLLLNADGGAGGVGATLTPDVGDDDVLSPGEAFTVDFVIGLQERKPFRFFVDLLGVSSP